MTQEPLVELVDDAGRPVGEIGKLAAHQAPGRRHRAVSVFLLDTAGRLILQRRSAAKYHSGGTWSNTCCGHPAPGEAPEAAARRRLGDELGLDVAPGELAEAGIVDYDVADPDSGLVEREHNHVFVGVAGGRPSPNPDEVEAVATVDLGDLDLPGGPRAPDGTAFTAWFERVLPVARPELERHAARAAAGSPAHDRDRATHSGTLTG